MPWSRIIRIASSLAPAPIASLPAPIASSPARPYAMQMTKVLDLIQSYIEQKGNRACRIDGSIPWQVWAHTLRHEQVWTCM